MSSPNHVKSSPDPSDHATEDSSYPHALAASFAGLPPKPIDPRSGDTAGKTPHSNVAAVKSKPQNDFLDLAEANRSSASSTSDITAKLELKRVEHERQRALQKLAFEEQMKLLELQQEQEERDLLDRDSNGAPVTARSVTVEQVALKPMEGEGRERRRADYANAKSMPGSRRHSGELNGDDVIAAVGAETRRALKADGTNMNSFLFDDELDGDLNNAAWGGKYLQMNTDDDKFPILIRRDSYPGILSASSAALDLAPLSQAPVSRNFRPNEARAASEWPQFQAQSRPSTVDQSEGSTVDRHRAAAQLADLASNSDRSRSIGAGTLPPPRSSLGGIGGTASATASGRNSPSVELNTSKGYANADLAKAPTGNYVDGLADQFSNFNIDSNAFGADPTQGAFGGYGGNDHGAFAYDGTNAYGTMGDKSGLYGVDGSAQMSESESNRFAGLRLEDLQGDMLPLCKDQFGCRYLQKKLEDGNPEHRDMIFNEIFPHFAELMTDPFANYLSQRLLEYSTDEQRDALIESISGELVSISLNMHGTRAVQKMIDYLSTQRQVQSLILALNLNVVTLIKDLNGNHVIQKCLNHLPPEDNQFIYNAVATHCIEVATHRHGCCVLQRCIDHASESQRIQLVTEITYNSLTLVQDAFGNYVVQYVLDLNDNRFIEAIVRQFLGNVSALSAQKFSSNVVEKCIRVADATGRRAIIDELLNKQRLERLLRDSFANYVVQTALDYAEPAQRAQLIDTIRPILPMIRNTPYGKRIQSKIQRETQGDNMMGRSQYNNGGGALVPGGMNGMFNNGMMNGNGQQHQQNLFFNQQYQQPPHPHHQQQMMNGQMNGMGGFQQQQFQHQQFQPSYGQQMNGQQMNGGFDRGYSNGMPQQPSMNGGDYSQQLGQQQSTQQSQQPSPF